jgi:hypothetical protein
MMVRAILATGLLSVVLAAPGLGAVLTETEKIERLLDVVRTSNIVFIRNGEEHTAPDAEQHLRGKWKLAVNEIATAHDFIAKLASRSSTTGEEYRVRLADGSELPSAEWLTARLAEIEGRAGAATTPSPGARPDVEEVLSVIRESGLWFLRVEDDETEERSGEDMARHVSVKYVLDGSPQVTADEFIRRYCSRSWLHDTEYRVKLDESRTMPLAEWLQDQISRRRSP